MSLPTPNTKPKWGTRWQYWRRFHLPNMLYLVLLLVIAVASFLWVQHNETTAVSKTVDPQAQDGFVEYAQVAQTSPNGHLNYHASIARVEHFGTGDLRGTDTVLTATPDKQPPVKIAAQHIEWRDVERVAILQNQVALKREAELGNADSAPLTVTAERIAVDMNKGLAQSDSEFEFRMGTQQINGAQFVYDYELRQLKMGRMDSQNTAQNSRIRAVINPKTFTN